MEVVQQTLAILFVFSLLGLCLWILRGRGSGWRLPLGHSGPRQLEALERLALTPQHSLHLVRAGGKELLVAAHPQGCTVVAESPATHKGASA